MKLTKVYFLQWAVSIFLMLWVVFINFSYTLKSKGSNKIQQYVSQNFSHNFFSQYQQPHILKYSFFDQYWNLFAPNPVSDKGFFTIQIITQSKDTINVLNGKIFDNKTPYTHLSQKILFQYLLYKKNNSDKNEIWMYCMLKRELKMLADNNFSFPIQKICFTYYRDKAYNLQQLQMKPVYQRFEMVSLTI